MNNSYLGKRHCNIPPQPEKFISIPPPHPLTVTCDASARAAMAATINQTHTFTESRPLHFPPRNRKLVARTSSPQKTKQLQRRLFGALRTLSKPDARENRSSESVKARVKTITKACTAFSGCYGRVIRMQPTGTNGTDLFRLATGLYNGTTMRNSADDCGKAFKFGLAWNVLKEYPRYSPFHADSDDSVNLGKTSEENGSNSDKAIESTDGSTGSERKDNCRDDRPTGRASAKKDVEKQRIAREKIKLANEALNAQRERTAAINKHYEVLLFTSGPAGLDQLETSEYFSTMRKRVLAKLRETEPK
eukprot:IDg5042t1